MAGRWTLRELRLGKNDKSTAIDAGIVATSSKARVMLEMRHEYRPSLVFKRHGRGCDLVRKISDEFEFLIEVSCEGQAGFSTQVFVDNNRGFGYKVGFRTTEWGGTIPDWTCDRIDRIEMYVRSQITNKIAWFIGISTDSAERADDVMEDYFFDYDDLLGCPQPEQAFSYSECSVNGLLGANTASVQVVHSAGDPTKWHGICIEHFGVPSDTAISTNLRSRAGGPLRKGPLFT